MASTSSAPPPIAEQHFVNVSESPSVSSYGTDELVDVYAVKRGRDANSSTTSNRPAAKRVSTDANGLPNLAPRGVPPMADQNAPVPDLGIGTSALLPNAPPPQAPKPKQRRKRNPPKKRVVPPERESDIWDKLDSVSVSMTMKDWIVHDKQARVQLREGLRYLDGRNSARAGKRPARTMGMQDPNVAMANMIYEPDSTGYDSTESVSGSDDSCEFFPVDGLSSYDSGDETTSTQKMVNL